MKESIQFYGTSEEVPQLLRGADIFVQPSHYEAFGLSVIEAMASGLPVIATRVGGMRDYLVDGENALLCDPMSPPDIARQINKLLGNVGFRNRLGNNGRNTVIRDFAESVVFGKFVHLFMDIIGSKRNRNRQK
jgi:glycosyltransferase involved in cell wall biosynthesis